MKYVPILKWKQGEKNALQASSVAVKSRITPMIEFLSNATEKAPCGAGTILADISKCWGPSKIFLDARNLDDGFPRESEHPKGLPGYPSSPPSSRIGPTSETLQIFLDTLRCGHKDGMELVPVVGIDSSKPLRDIGRTEGLKHGVCFRIPLDPGCLYPDDAVNELRYDVSIDDRDVDLIVDFGFLESAIEQSVVERILAMATSRAWRSVTLAGTSMPASLADVKNESILKRFEASLQRLDANVGFGDYGISHPKVPPSMFRGSANIRYTTSGGWYIARGRKLESEEGYAQYNELCRQIVATAFYCGKHFSAGDCKIFETARFGAKPGNPTTWKEVGTNHHLAFVIKELSDALASDGRIKAATDLVI